MFVSALKKAHDAVEGVAAEAAFSLIAILLACGAFLFAAIGFALWLSTMMPIYSAMLIIAGVTACVAGFVYYVGHHNQDEDSEEEKEPENTLPFVAAFKNLSSIGAPLDIVASGLFARQFKKAPIATVAATAAVGALLGMIADSNDNDD